MSTYKGKPIYLENVQEIVTVSPPEVDGERVAFVYLFYTGRSGYRSVFDFSPNHPDLEDEEFDPSMLQVLWSQQRRRPNA